MKFTSFFEEFPDLIESEFRNIFVLNDGMYKHIPPGNYAFLELFCPEIECDCRKVIINVISSQPAKSWAILNYGWESEKYYQTWFGKNNPLYQPMSGVTFDPPTNDPLKNEFLAIFSSILRDDQHYAQRIKRHYAMFKQKMCEKQIARTPCSIEKKPGRNEPCSCGSGKKFKHCCLSIH